MGLVLGILEKVVSFVSVSMTANSYPSCESSMAPGLIKLIKGSCL